MTKQLRDFIAVAGAHERWVKASLGIVCAKDGARDDHRVHYRDYAAKRREYERAYGEFLYFQVKP